MNASVSHADVAIAGAGLLGLSLALHAARQGLRVVVVDRDEQSVGASVRNFGHVGVTAQTGVALDYARRARTEWLVLRDEIGMPVRASGAVVVARSQVQLELLTEFAAARPGEVQLLPADRVGDLLGAANDHGQPRADDGVVGGAHLMADLVVDPRVAVAKLEAHLAGLGVRFQRGTSALGVEAGRLHTSRGRLEADRVFLAVNHELAGLVPEVTAAHGLLPCQLHMLRVAAPPGRRIDPAVLTGTSLLRYSGFTACPSASAVRDELAADRPQLLAAGVNHMFTQLPGGDLLIGDTHSYLSTPQPFAEEAWDELILRETCALLGVSQLTVRQRWLGVYASAPQPYLDAAVAPSVRAVAVTQGIGMTTALGFAADLLASDRPSVHPAAR